MGNRATISSVLKEARFQSGLSLDELSARSGVTVKQLTDIEKGKTEDFYSVAVCRKAAFAYAQALNVGQQIEPLWSDADWSPDPDPLGRYPLSVESKAPSLFSASNKTGSTWSLSPRVYGLGLLGLLVSVVVIALWRVNSPEPPPEMPALARLPATDSPPPGAPLAQVVSSGTEKEQIAKLLLEKGELEKALASERAALEKALAAQRATLEKTFAAEKAALELQLTSQRTAAEKTLLAEKAAFEKALAAERAALEKSLAAEKLAREKVAAIRLAGEKTGTEERPAARVSAPAPPPPAAAPAAQSSVASAQTNRLVSQVEQGLRDFAAHWSNRQPDAYLNLFDPSFPGLQAYASNRRSRMKSASFIEVKLEGITLKETAPGEITARFTQRYRSDTFQSIERKELVWRQTSAGPRIFLERKIN